MNSRHTNSSAVVPLMTMLLLIICILISVFTSSAQVSNDHIFKLKPFIVKVVNEKKQEQNTVVIKMDFGSNEILNPQDAVTLNGKAIMKVELVYTAFQVSDEFKQPDLNRARIDALRKLAPYVFKSTAVEWRVIGQNGCKNEYEAKKMFHGFLITYQPEPSTEFMKQEVENLISMTNNDSLGKDSMVEITKTRLRKHSERTGYYLPRSERKLKKGIRYSHNGIWDRKREYRVWYDTIFRKVKVPYYVVNKNAMAYLKKMFSFETSSFDTTVMAVLNRNKQWKDILFACDVTGSMSPYSAQLLIWNKLNFNARRAKYFTFFNDGDNTPDRKKRIGRTGGIYHTEASSVEDIEHTAQTAMTNGGGGDAPENDIEALLAAIEKCPDAGEVVLIADNLAPIKDIELLSKIKIPVHVILCGTQGGALNSEYIQLAYQTKGSIHTIESDLKDLYKLNEGAAFKLGKNNYILKNGKFELIYTL